MSILKKILGKKITEVILEGGENDGNIYFDCETIADEAITKPSNYKL